MKNPCKSLAWGVIVWRYAGDEPVVVFAHTTIIHPKPKEESMLIIAIDLGKFNSVACLYNTQTQKQQFDKRDALGAAKSGKGPWRLSRTLPVQRGLSIEFLAEQGLFNLEEDWASLRH